MILIEEAAFCDPQFFFETVTPLMLIGRTSMLCISTLTSSQNFYTRLFKMRDPKTGAPIFRSFSVELACQACKDEGKQASCTHMLHLVPSWQSSEKHERLHTIMESRPDLIQSELAGLAFDELQQAFREKDLERMIAAVSPSPQLFEEISIFVDPAAGGASSDYGILSVTHCRGITTVSQHVVTLAKRVYEIRYSSRIFLTNCPGWSGSVAIHVLMVVRSAG